MALARYVDVRDLAAAVDGCWRPVPIGYGELVAAADYLGDGALGLRS